MSAQKPVRGKLVQPTPKELVDSLMLTVREVFCPQMDQKEWFKDNYHFIRKWCVLWPASYIVGKGYTLPADRFKEILIGIVTEAKREARGPIDFVAAYLGKCVQSHFQKRWHLYYEEAKAVRVRSEHALLALGALPIQPDRTVEQLAQVNRALSSVNRKRAIAKPEQKELF